MFVAAREHFGAHHDGINRCKITFTAGATQLVKKKIFTEKIHVKIKVSKFTNQVPAFTPTKCSLH